METKPFYASKTLWVNLVAVVAALAGAFGLDLGFELDAETQVTIVGAIMGVVNIILRFTTKSALGG